LLSMVIGILTWIIFEAYESDWPSLVPATMASLAGMVVGSLMRPDKRKVHEN